MFFLSYSKRAAAFACAVAGLLASRAAADYNLPSDASTLSGTSIAVDGHCNLTEAVASVNAGHAINADCHYTGSSAGLINLTASFNSTPVYQLAAGTVISRTVYLETPSEYPAVVEAPGAAVFTVNAGATLVFTDIVVRHKAGSQGRVIVNHGTLYAYFSTFRDGDISGSAWPANGAGIYNDGSIPEMGYCVVKNNKAPNGSGGGIYNIGLIGYGYAGLNRTAISGNIAAQGGGIYSIRNMGSNTSLRIGQLTLSGVTINDNKTIANEVTSGGTITTGGGSPCNATTETAAKAFDDDFNTKWCSNAGAPPSGAAPVEVIYQFAGGAKQRVQSYSITTANDHAERDPADWTLAGSNTGAPPWTTLDTRTGEKFIMQYANLPGAGSRYLTRTYYFNNANSYPYYRLRITKNNGGNAADADDPGSGTASKATQFAELQLYADWKTGDGAGLFYTTHANFDNSTFSRNIAGCANSSCACPAGDDFCANPSSTNKTWGRGGGIFAGTATPESNWEEPGETFAKNLTVAGNSASQGGGFYQGRVEHWNYTYGLFVQNSARTSVNKEPDFHGIPHQASTQGGNMYSNQNGLVSTKDGAGFQPSYTDPDRIAANPMLRPLSVVGTGDMAGVYVHIPKSGSPAVDIIPANVNGSPMPVDQRLYSRPTGSGYDYGAIERQSTDP